MFVRIVTIVVALVFGVAACTPLQLFEIATQTTGEALKDNNAFKRLKYNYNCSQISSYKDLCKNDAEELASAEKARVCGPRMTSCRHAPKEEVSNFDRICYATTGDYGFCWFEDPNG